MSRRERIDAALQGAEVDRPPVTFWRHFPGRDHAAEPLAEATVEFQRRFNLDLVRVVPTGMYSVMDYGMVTRAGNDSMGSTEFVSGPIRQTEDWRRLVTISPRHGALGEQVRAVALVRAALGQDTPIIQTIFSPLTMAVKLAGNHLDERILGAGGAIHEALARMADDVVAFALASLEVGADGVFFLAMHANGSVDRATYDTLGVPYDLAVLSALRARARSIVGHLHGDNPFFDLADRYPLDAVSWEDRETRPSLSQALTLTQRCLVGGIGRNQPLVSGTRDDVTAQLRAVIEETGGRRIIIAPGCTLPSSVPEENLRALITAVQRED